MLIFHVINLLGKNKDKDKQFFLHISGYKKELGKLYLTFLLIYNCSSMRLSADFSGIPNCLPLGSLNLQLPPVLDTNVAVMPCGILPSIASAKSCLSRYFLFITNLVPFTPSDIKFFKNVSVIQQKIFVFYVRHFSSNMQDYCLQVSCKREVHVSIYICRYVLLTPQPCWHLPQVLCRILARRWGGTVAWDRGRLIPIPKYTLLGPCMLDRRVCRFEFSKSFSVSVA